MKIFWKLVISKFIRRSRGKTASPLAPLSRLLEFSKMSPLRSIPNLFLVTTLAMLITTQMRNKLRFERNVWLSCTFSWDSLSSKFLNLVGVSPSSRLIVWVPDGSPGADTDQDHLADHGILDKLLGWEIVLGDTHYPYSNFLHTVKPATTEFLVIWNHIISSVKSPIENTFARFSRFNAFSIGWRHSLELLDCAWFLIAHLLNLELEVDHPEVFVNPFMFLGISSWLPLVVFFRLYCSKILALNLSFKV